MVSSARRARSPWLALAVDTELKLLGLYEARVRLFESFGSLGILPPQCPDGTWICQTSTRSSHPALVHAHIRLTVSNRRPRHDGEEPRVLQVVPVAGAMHLPNVTHYRPGVNATAQLTPAGKNSQCKHLRNVCHPWGRADGSITANSESPACPLARRTLHVRTAEGRLPVPVRQRRRRGAILPPSADGYGCVLRLLPLAQPSTPTYAWSWNGTHTFQWRTKHACGSQRALPPADNPPSGGVGDEDQDTPPPDDESELRNGYPFSGSIARTRMILILSSCTALATLAYLAWRPPARVQQYISRFVKAHPRLARFRVGERMLVRWAYEDMEMAEAAYAPGEEDTMVNGEMGEGIPLKPSPRKGQWASYGAA